MYPSHTQNEPNAFLYAVGLYVLVATVSLSAIGAAVLATVVL